MDKQSELIGKYNISEEDLYSIACIEAKKETVGFFEKEKFKGKTLSILDPYKVKFMDLGLLINEIKAGSFHTNQELIDKYGQMDISSKPSSNGLKYIFPFVVVVVVIYLFASGNGNNSPSLSVLTGSDWFMETSNLQRNLDSYMQSRGVHSSIFRQIKFSGSLKSGNVQYYESIRGGQSCQSEGFYTVRTDVDGVFHLTITNLENSNGYCEYVSQINGEYVYKYMLYTDIDQRFKDTYRDKKTHTLSKGGVLFMRTAK